MNDVEVFKAVDGRKLEKFIATMPGVQASRRRAAAALGAVAKAEHAGYVRKNPREAGDAGSSIEVVHGPVDSFIVLNDERSDRAAYQVERNVRALAAAALAGGDDATYNL